MNIPSATESSSTNLVDLFFGVPRALFTFVSAFVDSVRYECPRRALFEGLNKPNWGLRPTAIFGKIYVQNLRSRIFKRKAVKFLACLPLLGFSNI